MLVTNQFIESEVFLLPNVIERQEDILKLISKLDISPTLYKNAEEKYKALADGQNKVIFGGRLGMYKYFDMHQVIEEALLVSEKELA